MPNRRPELKDVLESLVKYQVRIEKTTGAFGHIDFDNHIICIDPTYSRYERVETLIHEGIHAYREENNMSQSERAVNRDTKRILKEVYDGNR